MLRPLMLLVGSALLLSACSTVPPNAQNDEPLEHNIPPLTPNEAPIIVLPPTPPSDAPMTRMIFRNGRLQSVVCDPSRDCTGAGYGR